MTFMFFIDCNRVYSICLRGVFSTLVHVSNRVYSICLRGVFSTLVHVSNRVYSICLRGVFSTLVHVSSTCSLTAFNSMWSAFENILYCNFCYTPLHQPDGLEARGEYVHGSTKTILWSDKGNL